MVERFHQQLKVPWQPRSAFKADLQFTPAELTFDRILRLPGEMVAPTPPTDFNYGDYAAHLVHRMLQLHIQPSRQQTTLAYLSPRLAESSHILLRAEVRAPLQPQYSGPHKVLRRLKKAYVIERNGKREIISIDRIKSAHLGETDPCTNHPPPVAPPVIPVSISPAPSTPVNPATPLEQAPDPDPPHQITSP
ncbi:unnamed protein product [Echinostoma caproni]|uniref:Uncharacterized protein n=1 Tax=Echinostoma caproni TaxID=27848 RepID=A0A183BEJ3_9TREM|nr:unnamed protein product [Echinostoma caproni]